MQKELDNNLREFEKRTKHSLGSSKADMFMRQCLAFYLSRIAFDDEDDF